METLASSIPYGQPVTHKRLCKELQAAFPARHWSQPLISQAVKTINVLDDLENWCVYSKGGVGYFWTDDEELIQECHDYWLRNSRTRTRTVESVHERALTYKTKPDPARVINFRDVRKRMSNLAYGTKAA